MRSDLRIGTAFVERTGQAVVDLMGVAASTMIVDVPPRPIRQALLTFRSSIQGRLPEILGDDEEERVETLVVLLDGTSEDDLNRLIAAASEALCRLEVDHPPMEGRRQRSHRRRRAPRRSFY